MCTEEPLEQIHLVSVAVLVPHPYSSEVYVDYEDPTFDNDILEHGIREPLVINSENVILSGVRRWKRAVKYNLEKVPCIMRDFDDERLAIIMYNKYREKNPKERYLEAKYLKHLYEASYLNRIGKVRERWKQGDSVDLISREEGFSKSFIRKVTTVPIEVTEKMRGAKVLPQVAAEMGSSRSEIYKLLTVYDHEEEISEVAKRLTVGAISISSAYKALMAVQLGYSKEEVVEKLDRPGEELDYLIHKTERPPARPSKAGVTRKPEKRSRLEIRIDILKALRRRKTGISPTRVMYAVNLSWNPLQGHIGFLSSKGLIIESPDRYGHIIPKPGSKWRHLDDEGRRYLLLTSLGREILQKFLEIEPYLFETPSSSKAPRPTEEEALTHPTSRFSP